MRTLLTFVPLLVLSTAAKIPPNFHKCNRNSPDFQTCLLQSARKGILELVRPYPELTIPSLDPFELPEATIGGTEGPVNIQQKFKKCKFYGLPKLQVDDFEFSFQEKWAKLSGVFPEIQMLCDYEMKGQVLVVPVDGKGNSTIILKNVKVWDVLSYEETKKKGKTYPRFKTSSLKIDPELVVFDFESRVDKAFTDNLNLVLNDNWKAIFGDVKGSYEQMFDQIVLSVVNSFFTKVTLEEAFDSA
ncbi:hypothetical protein Zmor_016978 [Zophobas morio]|uniref:Circadian clock-controlled protein n=1 Tax=Zophobas morio TaxID=2755281 RepID=A0AA38MC24_9CUCU|nr:hypothetical protein Zmor_016978 [Zophobas morio]